MTTMHGRRIKPLRFVASLLVIVALLLLLLSSSFGLHSGCFDEVCMACVAMQLFARITAVCIVLLSSFWGIALFLYGFFFGDSTFARTGQQDSPVTLRVKLSN